MLLFNSQKGAAGLIGGCSHQGTQTFQMLPTYSWTIESHKQNFLCEQWFVKYLNLVRRLASNLLGERPAE